MWAPVEQRRKNSTAKRCRFEWIDCYCMLSLQVQADGALQVTCRSLSIATNPYPVRPTVTKVIRLIIERATHVCGIFSDLRHLIVIISIKCATDSLNSMPSLRHEHRAPERCDDGSWTIACTLTTAAWFQRENGPSPARQTIIEDRDAVGSFGN